MACVAGLWLSNPISFFQRVLRVIIKSVHLFVEYINSLYRTFTIHLAHGVECVGRCDIYLRQSLALPPSFVQENNDDQSSTLSLAENAAGPLVLKMIH